MPKQGKYGGLGPSKSGMGQGRMGGSSTRSMEEIRKEARTPFAKPAGAKKRALPAAKRAEIEPAKKRGRRS